MEVFVCKKSSNDTFVNGCVVKRSKYDDKDILFNEALYDSDPEKSCLIIHSSMTTYKSPEFLTKFLKDIEENIPDLDVFYLYRNYDLKSMNKFYCEHEDMKIDRVFSPHGITGLFITKKGKDKLKKVLSLSNGRGYDFALNAYCERLNAYTTRRCIFECKEQFVENRENCGNPKYHDRNAAPWNFLWFTLLMFFFFYTIACTILEAKRVDSEDLSISIPTSATLDSL